MAMAWWSWAPPPPPLPAPGKETSSAFVFLFSSFLVWKFRETKIASIECDVKVEENVVGLWNGWQRIVFLLYEKNLITKRNKPNGSRSGRINSWFNPCSSFEQINIIRFVYHVLFVHVCTVRDSCGASSNHMLRARDSCDTQSKLHIRSSRFVQHHMRYTTALPRRFERDCFLVPYFPSRFKGMTLRKWVVRERHGESTGVNSDSSWLWELSLACFCAVDREHDDNVPAVVGWVE